MFLPSVSAQAAGRTDRCWLYHDLLGLFDKFVPKFVKVYKEIGSEIAAGIGQYIAEVKSGAFPEEAHAFGGVTKEDLKDL